MKKGISKLLSALLIATLVFTSAGVAFAGTDEGTVKLDAQSSQLEAGQDDEALAAAIKNVKKSVSIDQTQLTKKKASGAFQVVTLNTGNEKLTNPQINYSLNDNALSGNYRGVATPIKFSAKGTLIMGMRALSNDKSGYVYFGLYKNAQLTQPVDGESIVSADNASTRTRVFKVPAAGTYYLGAYSSISSYSSAVAYAASTTAAYIKGNDRTLTNKKWSAVGLKDKQTNHLKFKATSTGYVTVYTKGFSGKITLRNSKKKSLSNAVSVSTYSPNVVFGVKKGTTYYLRTASNYNSDGGFQIRYINSKITEKSGKKKSKAVTIKAKKTKKGNIIAGSSQADWYKFKLTKKKNIRITMKGATNNKMSIAIYKGGKKLKTSSFYNTTKSLTIKGSRLTKGTYYIKVYRGTKTSSGWYSLTWK